MKDGMEFYMPATRKKEKNERWMEDLEAYTSIKLSSP
jgi:hypothetical protein